MPACLSRHLRSTSEVTSSRTTLGLFHGLSILVSLYGRPYHKAVITLCAANLGRFLEATYPNDRHTLNPCSGGCVLSRSTGLPPTSYTVARDFASNADFTRLAGASTSNFAFDFSSRVRLISLGTNNRLKDLYSPND